MKKLAGILLVDDDETTNFVNQILLEDLAVADQVIVASNGREALERIEQQGHCPELILLDLNMPVMNGFEFLEAYQQLTFQGKQGITIIVLTTSVNPTDLDRLRQLPIQGFLNKPLSRTLIRDLLKQYFHREIPG